MAMAVVAGFLEVRAAGLLLPLLSVEAGHPSLVQRLIGLLDAATHAPDGEGCSLHACWRDGGLMALFHRRVVLIQADPLNLKL